MEKYKQIFIHDPENGIFGDCYRTCIACLLNVTPDVVPHNHSWGKPGEQIELVNKFLIERYDLKMIGMPIIAIDGNLESIFNFVHYTLKDIRYILTGESKNGVNHSVICLNGEIIHDPSHNNSGIVGPCNDGYFWIEFLLPYSIHGVQL